MKKLNLFFILTIIALASNANAADISQPKVLATTTYVDDRVNTLPVGTPPSGDATDTRERVEIWIQE